MTAQKFNNTIMIHLGILSLKTVAFSENVYFLLGQNRRHTHFQCRVVQFIMTRIIEFILCSMEKMYRQKSAQNIKFILYIYLVLRLSRWRVFTSIATPLMTILI